VCKGKRTPTWRASFPLIERRGVCNDKKGEAKKREKSGQPAVELGYSEDLGLGHVGKKRGVVVTGRLKGWGERMSPLYQHVPSYISLNTERGDHPRNARIRGSLGGDIQKRGGKAGNRAPA